MTEVDEAALRPFRIAFTRTVPVGHARGGPSDWPTWSRMIAGDVRFFAVLEEGDPVAATDLYLSEGDAQVEDVATLGTTPAAAATPRRSFMRAVEEARSASADFVLPRRRRRRLAAAPLPQARVRNDVGGLLEVPQS